MISPLLPTSSGWIASIGLSALLLTGCLSQTTPKSSPPEIVASCFDATTDGNTVHLLYGDTTGADKRLALNYRSWDPQLGKWSVPAPVPTNHAVPGNHHRGNDPQIAVRGAHVMAVWTAQGKGPFGSGPIGVALSADGGKTWKPGPSPTPSGDIAGYRFPATAAGPEGFHLVWIHAQGEERSLRYSRLNYGATEWETPTVIDPECCACCWNEMQVDAEGKIYVLYRDADPRDMALAVLGNRDGEWEQLSHAGQFNWKFDGCPHVGGGLAVGADDQQLLASVWSGSDRWLGAYALNSVDGGSSWAKPLKLRNGDEQGRHSDIAQLGSGIAAVAWDQLSEEGGTVHLSLSNDGGSTWNTAKQLSPVGSDASYPRVMATGSRFLVFWSEKDGNGISRIRVQDVSQNGHEAFTIPPGPAAVKPRMTTSASQNHNHH